MLHNAANTERAVKVGEPTAAKAKTPMIAIVVLNEILRMVSLRLYRISAWCSLSAPDVTAYSPCESTHQQPNILSKLQERAFGIKLLNHLSRYQSQVKINKTSALLTGARINPVTTGHKLSANHPKPVTRNKCHCPAKNLNQFRSAL